MGLLDIKSKQLRNAIVGQPVILISQGKILENKLRTVRLDIDSLNSLLRKKNVFSITDVDYAIFKTDGSLSVLKKELKQSLLKEDVK